MIQKKSAFLTVSRSQALTAPLADLELVLRENRALSFAIEIPDPCWRRSTLILLRDSRILIHVTGMRKENVDAPSASKEALLIHSPCTFVLRSQVGFQHT